MVKVCKPDGEGTIAGTRGNGEVAPISDHLLKTGDQPTFQLRVNTFGIWNWLICAGLGRTVTIPRRCLRSISLQVLQPALGEPGRDRFGQRPGVVGKDVSLDARRAGVGQQHVSDLGDERTLGACRAQ